MLNLSNIFLINVAIVISIIFSLFISFDILMMYDIDRYSKEELKGIVESKLFVLFLAVTIVCISIMLKFNRKVKKEIEKIDIYLDEINKKRYNKKIKLNYSKEFYFIGRKLKQVIQKMRKRDKRKRRDRAMLRLANQQQEQLIGAISHELKNPMSSIMSYSQMLKDELSEMENISKDQIGFLSKILNNSKRMEQLLSRLRVAVQLENRRFQLDYKFFNLKDLIDGAVLNLKSEYQKRDIILKVNDYQLYADFTLIELVVINLIENGLKYSQNELIIEVRDNKLRIIDYGIGIDHEELEHIKKRFYRISKNNHMQSMGLGLAIVDYILKIHNLKLEIQSEINRGSIFSIDLLPIKKPSIPTQFKPIATEVEIDKSKISTD